MVICSLRRGLYPKTNQFFVVVKPWSGTIERIQAVEDVAEFIYPLYSPPNKTVLPWTPE